MGRHRTLSADFIELVRSVAIARRQLPSDKALAIQGKVSVRTVQTIMHETFPRVYELSIGAESAHNPAPCPSDEAGSRSTSSSRDS